LNVVSAQAATPSSNGSRWEAGGDAPVGNARRSFYIMTGRYADAVIRAKVRTSMTKPARALFTTIGPDLVQWDVTCARAP
jgi:hypothetical protein